MIIRTDSSKIYCTIIWLDSTTVFYSRFDNNKEQSIAKAKVWQCYNYKGDLLYENKKFIAFLERDEEQDTTLLAKDTTNVISRSENSSVRIDTIKQTVSNFNAELIQNEGKAYYYQGQRITMMQMKRIMSGNSEASQELKEALSKKSDYRVFRILGASMLSSGIIGIGTYSISKTGSLGAGIILTGIGIGFIIPVYIDNHIIYKRINKAVTIYNTQISESEKNRNQR